MVIQPFMKEVQFFLDMVLLHYHLSFSVIGSLLVLHMFLWASE
uniref:Uncharacterized protein n=1 Tax=Rhizophora mucronata TaxID=61149 RepID=A0A2P2LB90_RHIMU